MILQRHSVSHSGWLWCSTATVQVLRKTRIITSQNHHCCLHILRTQNLNFFRVNIIPEAAFNSSSSETTFLLPSASTRRTVIFVMYFKCIGMFRDCTTHITTFHFLKLLFKVAGRCKDPAIEELPGV